MSGVVIDTHVLLWMLDGTLPRRSATAAQRLVDALGERNVHVSIGTFLDLRYLVDAGRMPDTVLEEAERTVERAAFTVMPLDLRVHEAMGRVARDEVPDPFDRIIAASALVADLPLLTADRRIRAALGARAVW